MKVLQKNLLEKFSTVREYIVTIADKDLQKDRLLEAALEVCDKYDGIIALNYKELMEQQLANLDYNVDAFIHYLTKSIQDPFDHETNKREAIDAFDEKYGSKTSSIFEQMELPEQISEDRLKYAARFHPSPVKMVRRALDELANLDISYHDCTFIDIGSGLGRNLLLASPYGFKHIVGVEISAYLCEQAVANIKKYNAVEPVKCNAEICCMDILNYPLPDGNLVLYFWEPFMDEMADKFVKQLEDHVTNSLFAVTLVFLGRVFPAIINSPSFKQVGKHINSTEKTIGLGITYFQGVETLAI